MVTGMPMPNEYAHASRDFDAFLSEAKGELGLATRHMTYTTVQAVLLVFRRRLSVEEAISFADVLPPVLRAIFVAEWDLQAPRKPFGALSDMNADVKDLRPDHNFSPDDAIQCVARALRRHVDRPHFEQALKRISTDAQAFWMAD